MAGKQICVSSIMAMREAVNERARDREDRTELLDGDRKGRVLGFPRLHRDWVDREAAAKKEGIVGIQAPSYSDMER